MMVKIGLIGIAAIFLAAPLRKEKGEFSMLIVLVAGMLVFVYALARMQTILAFQQGVRLFVTRGTNGIVCKAVHHCAKYTGAYVSGGCIGEFFVDG